MSVVMTGQLATDQLVTEQQRLLKAAQNKVAGVAIHTMPLRPLFQQGSVNIQSRSPDPAELLHQLQLLQRENEQLRSAIPVGNQIEIPIMPMPPAPQPDPQAIMFRRDSEGVAGPLQRPTHCPRCGAYSRHAMHCETCHEAEYQSWDRYHLEGQLLGANGRQTRLEKRLLNHSAHLVGGWKRLP